MSYCWRNLVPFTLLTVLVGLGCDPGSVTINAIIPVDLEERDIEIGVIQVRSFSDNGSLLPVREAMGLSGVVVPDIPDGRWTFTLNALNPNGDHVLQGSTVPVDVKRQKDVQVDVLLAPFDDILEMPDDLLPRIDRCNPTATSVDIGSTAPGILITGGDFNGERQRDAWLYKPGQLTFEEVEAMNCPRTGHAAVRVVLADDNEQVLIAGGGTSECGGLAAGRTAAETIEIFEPRQRRFVPFHAASSAVEMAIPGALLASLGTDLALLLNRRTTEVWIINIAARTLIQIGNGGLQYDRAYAAVTIGDPQSSRVVVLGSREGSANLWVFDESGFCGSAPINIDPTRAEMTAISDDRLLIASARERREIHFEGCEIHSELEPESMDPIQSRDRPAAVVLESANGALSVLLIGGLDSCSTAQQTEIFQPSQPIDIGIVPPNVLNGPTSLHCDRRHGAVPLADGTVLIFGCDAATEIYNPRRSISR